MTTKNDKQKESSLVLTIGCESLTPSLMENGFGVHSYATEEEVPHSSTLGLPRAIALRSTVLKAKSTEDCVANFKKIWPLIDIVVWAPRCSADLALGVMKAGAKDVVLQDDPVEMVETITKIIHQQQIMPRVTKYKRRRRDFNFEGLVSRDPKMWDIFEKVSQVAHAEASVLILGETGTGKELLARAIHNQSHNSGKFVAVNCGAISENLIDSELFGHVKGAFTGANSDKKGLFRFADNGTLFLDEIGSMPLPSQYHLLRVLQENKVRPVGGHAEIPINVRIIAATSDPLDSAVKNERFREDLMYRLDVIRLVIPPLRERKDDIVFLFSYFLKKYCKQYRLDFPKMSDEFLDKLVEYDWPGNVRQLGNIAERMVLTCAGERLTVSHLEKNIKPNAESSLQSSKSSASVKIGIKGLHIDFDRSLDEIMGTVTDKLERLYLDHHLKKNRGRIQPTAEAAGINRRTLLRKLNKLGIDKNVYKSH